MKRLSTPSSWMLAALLAPPLGACATQSGATRTGIVEPAPSGPAPSAAPLPPAAPPTAGATRAPAPFVVGRRIAASPLERRRVASGLNNPRGMLVRDDGSLLVSVAGRGDPSEPATGALLSLRDTNGDGDYDDAGERTPLLDKQPSKNILEIVQRDEVFGMADIAEGGGMVLATLALFGGPSTVFRIDGQQVDRWATIHGNLNDIAYDAKRRQWFAVSSSSDEVLRIHPDGRGDRVVKLPPMAQGQDPVPGYLRSDADSGTLLVSLFSGSTLGEAGGDGTDIVSGAGSIIRVDPDTGATTPVVTGLTAPTDFWVEPGGTVYVLELCDSFLEPIDTRDALTGSARHGGFRRFSGRLLRIDSTANTTVVVADRLDAPTNLARRDKDLLVAQGMGTPGRSIPGPDGAATQLEGFIEAVRLP